MPCREESKRMRRCRTCNEIMSFNNFHKAKNGERHYHCKICRNEKHRLESTKETNRKQYLKVQSKSAKEKLELSQRGQKRCSGCSKIKTFEHYSINGSCYRSKCRSCMRKHYNNRIAKDPNFKIRHNVARRILLALRGGSKQLPTMKLVGCSAKEYRTYLESKFQEGMTWENYGRSGWHIDHIVPCCSFELTDLEQQKKCFHHSNTQPLWANENLKKSGKVL